MPDGFLKIIARIEYFFSPRLIWEACCAAALFLWASIILFLEFCLAERELISVAAFLPYSLIIGCAILAVVTIRTIFALLPEGGRFRKYVASQGVSFVDFQEMSFEKRVRLTAKISDNSGANEFLDVLIIRRDGGEKIYRSEALDVNQRWNVRPIFYIFSLFPWVRTAGISLVASFLWELAGVLSEKNTVLGAIVFIELMQKFIFIAGVSLFIVAIVAVEYCRQIFIHVLSAGMSWAEFSTLQRGEQIAIISAKREQKKSNRANN